MDQVAAANQSLRAAEANYRQAQAFVQASRAGLYPTEGVNLSATRARQGSGATASVDNLGVPVDWEIDLWGKIRRAVEASEDSVQASAADLGPTHLSLQAQLPQANIAFGVTDQWN